MKEIQIGKEGWKAIIASDFTVENVRRVAEGTAKWMKKHSMSKVIIAFDCRFGGLMFARKVAKVMAASGFQVIQCEKFATTAMLASAVMTEKADIGIMISGGTKAYFFSGYKLISSEGRRLEHNIEAYIPEHSSIDTESIKTYKNEGKITLIDLEEAYFARTIKRFDIDGFLEKQLRIVIDSMHGATQSVLQNLLPSSLRLRMDYNPSFNEVIPNPTKQNLELLTLVCSHSEYIQFGIGLSGDGEKFLICDENGHFVDYNALTKQLPTLVDLEDGVWVALTLLEHIALTGMKLSEI